MVTSEGDSGYVARLGLAARADRWDGGPPHRAPGDDAAAGVARRLQGRLDRHLWLLDRLQAEQLYAEPPGLPELLETARRMRRDTESLLLLCGHEPGVRATGPRRLSDLVGDAAAAAEEPRRVDVRPAPSATVSPAASVEFQHVLAELVDHVTAVYPGARLELVSRIEARGATVDVTVDGAARHDPDGHGGQRAAAAAEQLAQRSSYGIVLHRPPGGPPLTGSGLVASVHCPPAAVTVEQPAPPPAPAPADPLPSRTNGNGFPQYASGLGYGLDSGNGNGVGNGLGNGVGNGLGNGVGNGNGNGNGGARPAAALDRPSAPAYSPSASSQVDELFGPLLDLPLEPLDDRYATPIFEAIASAWFQEDAPEPAPAQSRGRPQGGGGDPLDWETPQDNEWRAAAARAARSESAPTTASGLPRRRPGNQLVPPPRGKGPLPASGPAERVPDRVRERLSTYQRGLRQGRHRAPGEEDGPEPGNW
jgi:hypothetical protein